MRKAMESNQFIPKTRRKVAANICSIASLMKLSMINKIHQLSTIPFDKISRYLLFKLGPKRSTQVKSWKS